MNQKPISIQLNENVQGSVYDWIANKISSHEFRYKIRNFIDNNCVIFLDDNVNSFQHGIIFKDMNILLERLLKAICSEGNISREDFSKASERGIKDEKYKKYFLQIERLRDYSSFRKVMVERNIDLMKLAEKQLKMKNINEGKTQITPEILSLIFSKGENEILNNRIELKNQKDEKHAENSKLDVYDSTMPAPVNAFQSKKKDNKESNKKNEYKEHKIEKKAEIKNKPEKEEKLGNDYSKLYERKGSKRENLEDKIDLENSYKTPNKENLENNPKKKDNDVRLYCLPQSINEDIREYNEQNQTNKIFEKRFKK